MLHRNAFETQGNNQQSCRKTYFLISDSNIGFSWQKNKECVSNKKMLPKLSYILTNHKKKVILVTNYVEHTKLVRLKDFSHAQR